MNIRRTVPALLAGALWLLSIPCLALAGEGDTDESAIRESVVKISATMRQPDLFRPWTKQSPRDVSGTGVVIEGKRILTNAHVVLYASQLFVESHESSDKLVATVEAEAQADDLGLAFVEGSDHRVQV